MGFKNIFRLLKKSNLTLQGKVSPARFKSLIDSLCFPQHMEDAIGLADEHVKKGNTLKGSPTILDIINNLSEPQDPK